MRKNLLLLLVGLLTISCHYKNKNPRVTTFAGSGALGSANGEASTASFSGLMGLAADSAGNIYVADSRNNLIRKVAADGHVTTLAGNGSVGSADGKGDAASFFFPEAIAVDKNGVIYIADTQNKLIRKITQSGVVSTIAGEHTVTKGLRDTTVRFDTPSGIAVDKNGNIFVADLSQNLIRKISTDGKISTVAGNGDRGSKNGRYTSASFYVPEGIALDVKGNLYIADSYNNMIRKVSPCGMVVTLAGKSTRGSADGKGSNASFWHPNGLVVDKSGNIYVADVGNNKIRKITPDGVVSTLAGSGLRGSANGDASQASFYQPTGLALDKNGNIYVADYQNNLIRKINF